MARELGLNPKKFGGLNNHRQEPWKVPLPEFIEDLYHKRFGRILPDPVISIEELAARRDRKKAEQRETRRLQREASGDGEAD
ncbi:MAG: hypothetical protein NTX84_08995 [Nitrospirae bacterium]|nr:hypothetical protein [Nitrospirota bacterium]